MRYEIHEGETKRYGADGDFTVQVKDGVAIIVPFGCFAACVATTPATKDEVANPARPGVFVKLPVQYAAAELDIITAIQTLMSKYVGCKLTESLVVDMKLDLCRALQRAVHQDELVVAPGFDLELSQDNKHITINWHDPTFWGRWLNDHGAVPL